MTCLEREEIYENNLLFDVHNVLCLHGHSSGKIFGSKADM
jgi:hypothetical protein